MKKPNIFEHATKELTQDAFICWLASWANPKYKSQNKNLHETGKDLISAFLSKSKLDSKIPIKSVCVRSQYKRIDVLLLINNDIWILIEDKTDTKDHGGQLQKYVKIVQDIDKQKKVKRKLACIYFKTGDQSNYSSLTGNNYKYYRFSRNDMIDVLRNGEERGVEHPFFTDYLDHLRKIQRVTNSYQNTPIADWRGKKHKRWIGFYMALQEPTKSDNPLIRGEWGYIPNQSGGFMGFWWRKAPPKDGSGKYTELEKYMQLEDGKLCFKIDFGGVKEKRVDHAKQWADELTRIFDHKKYAVEKAKLRAGKTMTVAKLCDRGSSNSTIPGYMVVAENGCIDMQGTINQLNRISKLHGDAVKNDR